MNIGKIGKNCDSFIANNTENSCCKTSVSIHSSVSLIVLICDFIQLLLTFLSIYTKIIIVSINVNKLNCLVTINTCYLLLSLSAICSNR